MNTTKASVNFCVVLMLASSTTVEANVEISIDSIEVNEQGGSFFVSAFTEEPTNVGAYGINLQFDSFDASIETLIYDAQNLVDGMSELGSNFGTTAHPTPLDDGNIVRYVALGNTVISGLQPLMQVDFTVESGFTSDNSFNVSILELEDQPTVRTFVGEGTITTPPVTTITGPEQLTAPCDLDRDGVCSATDIDLLSAEIRGGDPDVDRFDLDGDGTVDNADRLVWIGQLMNTFVGDADLDGVFDSGDFVQVFSSNEYEDAVAGNSTWATGDWNGDADFDSGDFVAAFTEGGYEQGPKAANVVPEPQSSAWLLACAGAMYGGLLRRRNS